MFNGRGRGESALGAYEDSSTPSVVAVQGYENQLVESEEAAADP